MRTRSYTVVWRESDGPLMSGRLELHPAYLLLEGSAPSGRASLQKIFYRELAQVRIGRAPADRLQGRQALVIERAGAAPLKLAAVDGAGILHELAERLGKKGADERVEPKPRQRAHASGR